MAEEKDRYPWYETVHGNSVCQGDILFNFDVLVPNDGGIGKKVTGEIRTYDVVVMTQTCDIVNGKVESLLICPCWELKDFVAAARTERINWGSQQREELRRGNIPGYYLANEAEQDGLKIGLTVIDFHQVYSTPIKVVDKFTSTIGKRLRLLPPYREHLAQAFARFFMRVGLPVDISPEKLKVDKVKSKEMTATTPIHKS